MPHKTYKNNILETKSVFWQYVQKNHEEHAAGRNENTPIFSFVKKREHPNGVIWVVEKIKASIGIQ